MRSLYTALIHLRDPIAPGITGLMESMLSRNRGVQSVRLHPPESLVVVEYDRNSLELAEIVRLIEDCGSVVMSLGQRQVNLLRAG